MNDLPKTILKSIALAALFVLPVVAWWLFIPAGLIAGYSFAKMLQGNNGSQLRKHEKQHKALQKALEKRAALEKEKFYSKKEGWKAEGLPYDMVMGVPSSRSAKEVFLEVADLKGMAFARQGEDGTSFHLLLKDQAAVAKAEAALAGGRVPASIRREADGKLYLVSAQPECISKLAKDIYPAKDVDYSREVTHSRQYIVENCSSYGEALAKLKADRGAYPVVNSFVSVKETMDGKSRETTGGHALDKASIVSLPSGAYVVTESSVTNESAMVRIPGDLRTEEDIRRFAGNRLEDVQSRHQSRLETSYSDGTPEGAARGAAVELSPVSGPAVAELVEYGLKAYVIVDSPEKAAEIARQGKFPEGSFVSVGRDVPLLQEGCYAVSVDIKGVGDLLRYRSASAAVPGGTGPLGEEEYASMAGEIARRGYASAVTVGDVSLRGALVNGVLPASELADRVASRNLDRLDSKELGTWIADASKIESVNISFNAYEGTMTVTSQVGGSVRQETHELSDEQLKSLQGRPKPSVAEMKDLLMQTNPRFFETYRAVRSSAEVPARSVYKDPLGDFLRGRRPERALTAQGIIRQARQKRNESLEAHKGGPKR